MKRNQLPYLAAIVCLLLVTTSPVPAVSAQGGEIRESFVDESLQGWERSEGVSVVAESLHIPPGNFAVRFQGPPGQAYSFDFKRSHPGVLIFRYAIGPEGEYILIIHDQELTLEKGGEGPPRVLDEGQWEGSFDAWHTVNIQLDQTGQKISIDETQIFSIQEESPLRGGGIGFWVEGEGTGIIDNLVISGFGAPPANEAAGPAPIETGAQAAVTPQPTASESDLSITDLFAELTNAPASPADLTAFLINLGLSVLLSYILSRVYVHWGSSLSNRRRFAANFILITVTTTFIILVVRSSVALSLGLVGALSIVRFRSAIKEPEELAYLFFAIAIGIGLGDNQRLITVIALAAAIGVLGIMRLFRGRQADFNLYLTIAGTNPSKADFETVVDTLKGHSSQLKLIRFDESSDSQEMSFLVEFRDMKQLKEAKSALQSLSEGLQISFLDNKGIW